MTVFKRIATLPLTLIYVGLGLAWIAAGSFVTADLILSDPDDAYYFEIGKGVLFVLITGAVFHALMTFFSRRVERQARLVETASTATGTIMMVIDDAHIIRYANRTLQRVSGENRADAKGQKLSALQWPEGLLKRLEKKIDKVFQDGDPQTGEMVLPDGDGKSLDYAYSIDPYKNPKGEYESVIFTAKDVTDVMAAREAKRATEERMKQTLSALDEIVWNIDLTTGGMTWNDDAVVRLLGDEHVPEDLKEWTRNIHPADREAFTDAVETFLAGHQHRFEHQYRMKRADGSIVWVHSRGHVTERDRNDKPLRGVGVTFDISEAITAREQTERLQRSLTAIEGANKAMLTARDKASLVQAVCDTLGDRDLYHSAWYGKAVNDSEKSVQVLAASAGIRVYADRFQVSWDESQSRGNGPVGVAIRTGRTQVSRNLLEDLSVAPWHDLCRELGVHSSLTVPVITAGQIHGALTVQSTQVDAFHQDEVGVIETLCGDLAFSLTAVDSVTKFEASELGRQEAQSRAEKALVQAITALTLVLEKRDPYTAGHVMRVADLAVAIARKMKLPAEQIKGLQVGALLHDIGKIAVPAEILAFPGRVSEEQLDLIKTHPDVGHAIVEGIDFEWPIARMVWEHHERLDGSGYPRGLKGDDILLEARIIAVADVVEAVHSHRPYRPGQGMDKAIAILNEERGTKLDADVVDACIKVITAPGFTL